MSSAFDALMQRRSIRNYDPNFVIPKEDLQKIITATLNSPSALNFQEHDLLVITNKDKIKAIDDNLFPSLPKSFQDRFVDRQKVFGTINPITYDCSALILIHENERAEKRWSEIDAGILSMAIMTVSKSLGYDTVCLGCIVNPIVEKLFDLKEGSLKIGVAIGKPKEKVNLHEKETLRKVKYIE